MTRVAVERALLSVFDKSGLSEFAAGLAAAGVEIISSGGTAAALEVEGIEVVPVEAVTGFPEMLGGRVKTLHPLVHGGILADPADAGHRSDLEELGVSPIQLVVVNLYPFEQTSADPRATSADIIEHIDIGGPAMIRAAAKNHANVAIVTHPDQYDVVLEAIVSGGIEAELREELAAAAFFRTAGYDAAIVGWFERNQEPPGRVAMVLERVDTLRYGENPHQEAAAYVTTGVRPWWVAAEQIQGKAMSFNNYLDAEAAWRVVNDFDDPAAVVVKHANPCGLAVRTELAPAFTAAWECDPLSAFGGIVAVNRTLDGETAKRISEAGFVEVVVAPEVTDKAKSVLAAKTNLRLLTAAAPDAADSDFRRIEGGFVLQDRDRLRRTRDSWELVANRSPDPHEIDDLEFAWTVAAHAKSNAIVVARERAAIGVGAGDQSRVGAAERALSKAGARARGAVAASDAFLPFRDALDTLAAAGVTAIIEPGGSRRDAEVIAAADEHDMALIFTGRRHFRH